MDIEQLTAFDRVVREGSFSRAARELHLPSRRSAREFRHWNKKLAAHYWRALIKA